MIYNDRFTNNLHSKSKMTDDSIWTESVKILLYDFSDNSSTCHLDDPVQVLNQMHQK